MTSFLIQPLTSDFSLDSAINSGGAGVDDVGRTLHWLGQVQRKAGDAGSLTSAQWEARASSAQNPDEGAEDPLDQAVRQVNHIDAGRWSSRGGNHSGPSGPSGSPGEGWGRLHQQETHHEEESEVLLELEHGGCPWSLLGRIL